MVWVAYITSNFPRVTAHCPQPINIWYLEWSSWVNTPETSTSGWSSFHHWSFVAYLSWIPSNSSVLWHTFEINVQTQLWLYLPHPSSVLWNLHVHMNNSLMMIYNLKTCPDAGVYHVVLIWRLAVHWSYTHLFLNGLVTNSIFGLLIKSWEISDVPWNSYTKLKYWSSSLLD